MGSTRTSNKNNNRELAISEGKKMLQLKAKNYLDVHTG
jgi:hypothetical protein